MKHLLAALLFVLLANALAFSQAPAISSPVGLSLGLGGGVSIPTGDAATGWNTGWNGGAKLRLTSVLPVTIVGSAAYHSLPEKVTDKKDAIWMVGGGLEYALPGVGVSPYLGVDLTANIFDNQGSGSSSTTRGGLGFGGGLQFSLPGFGSFDASVKYQMLNALGKEANEVSLNQVAAGLTLMATIL